MRPETMPKPSDYPEHQKLQNVSEHSQVIGEFLDWMQCTHGAELAYYTNVDYGYSHTKRELVFMPGGVQKWLAEFFDIDLAKIEDEKRIMLAKMREAH